MFSNPNALSAQNSDAACVRTDVTYSYIWVVLHIGPFLHRRARTGRIQTDSMAFSLQAKYTDRVAPTGRRIIVPASADRGVSFGQRGGSPTVVYRSFLDRSRYFF
jgi:hypothetical protein